MKNSSRREFVAHTAALSTLPLVGVSMSDAFAQSKKKQLGFALCGLGKLSAEQLAPALQLTKHAKLTGIVTGTPAKAKEWKQKYNLLDKNIYSYDNMHEMANNPDIDVVYVVTPNSLHARDTIAAAKAGKHVFCEKPMEVSVEKCQQMIDACKAANRMLGIAYRCQFEPHHLECIRIAREKEFGNLKMINAGFCIKTDDPTQWRLRRDLAGGGCLMDVGVYALQAAMYLSGEEPVAVTAIETKTDQKKFSEVEETISFQLKFPSGVIGNCVGSYNFYDEAGYRVFAENGWFGLEHGFYYEVGRGFRSDGKPLKFAHKDHFALEMDHFAECILNNAPTKVPGEMGLRDVHIMMKIYEALKSGKEVRLA
jgi:predicted dehydrogenase